MADSTIKARVIGRQGGGRDGAPGGLCFYSGGREHRVEPGDTVELPSKTYFEFLNDGLVEPVEQPRSTWSLDVDIDDEESEEDDA